MVTHKSLAEEIIAWKSHNGTCVETHKVTLFGLLVKALEDGPLESALQPHEKTKDSQAIVKEMFIQHGGRVKRERAYTSVTTQLDSTKWNSANSNRTLTNHIAKFRVTIVDIKRCCKHTSRTAPTVREQVLKLIDLIVTADSLLIAKISMVNCDPNGLGSSFEKTAAHLMLADPIEKKLKSYKKTPGGASISSALVGRGNIDVNFRWYDRDEFKLLSQDQKDELIE